MMTDVLKIDKWHAYFSSSHILSLGWKKNLLLVQSTNYCFSYLSDSHLRVNWIRIIQLLDLSKVRSVIYQKCIAGEWRHIQYRERKEKEVVFLSHSLSHRNFLYSLKVPRPHRDIIRLKRKDWCCFLCIRKPVYSIKNEKLLAGWLLIHL